MRAAQFYELVRAGKRAEIVEQYEVIKKEALTRAEQAAFADAVERARVDLAAQLYQHGLDKVRAQRWQEAATAFEDSLRYKEDSPAAPSVKLRLGDAYRHLGKLKEAIVILGLLEGSSMDREIQDDVLYLLAHCQMDAQSWNDAKNSWRTLLRKFPDSHFAAEAKLQLAQLQLMH